MKENIYIQKEKLREIADMLLLQGTLVKCPGLVHGKVGIAIFFYYYARYMKNSLFMDYAYDLIEVSQKQLHANYRADYEKGITGIGIGIDYLVQYDFLDIADDIFEDFDERIYRAVLYDPCSSFSLYEGLAGYGRYWILRSLRKPSSQQPKDCLLQIVEQIENAWQNICCKELCDVYNFLNDLQTTLNLDVSGNLFKRVRRLISMINPNNFCTDTFFNLKLFGDLDVKNVSSSMGLLSGFAGKGLSLLTLLGAADTSWIQLLRSSFTLNKYN